ncbi:MAG TPA: ribosome maturation factor RimM [Chitinophagaceae bacterium]
MADYTRIGKFVATHGVKGELVLKHDLGKKTALKGLEKLFIEDRKDSFLPWFIKSAHARSTSEALISLEGVDSREAALRFNQKEVWFADADVKKFAVKSAPVNLLGYMVVNAGEELAPVLEVIEQPHQVLCRVDISGKEVLIPLNESSLKKIDHRGRKIIVELPDGLLDIYLGG